MPWENVGSCGSGQLPGDRDWILRCYELAMYYLSCVLGDPPAGCYLGIMWHEHDYGEYPSLGVRWGHPQSDPPWTYIRRCEIALSKFDEAIEWSDISPSDIESELEAWDASDFDEET